MGRYSPNSNTVELLLEVTAKEAQLRAEEAELAQVLSRLEGLAVTDETKAMLQRYVNGELTIQELDTAIDQLHE